MWNKRKTERLSKFRTKSNKRAYPYNIPWKSAKPVPFVVYKIPTNLLSYNFKNTRIKAELEGRLYQKHERPDPNSSIHHDMIQDILLHSKWIGELETNKLIDDLLKRGQLDPVIATPDGVLIDGNRRLAIFRYLDKNEPKSKGFSELETCFLPENATENDLKELEMRLQMYHLFKVKYGDINTALEFRYLHRDLRWSTSRISDITGNQYTETQIEKMIEIIDMVDEYLDEVPPPKSHRKQYATLDKGWESFDNIYRMLKWTEQTKTKDKKLLKNRKLFGFEIIYSGETTYSDVRKFYSILRFPEACKKLETLSETLQGKNLSSFLSKTRVKKEIQNLNDVDDFMKSLKVEPHRVAEQALKKLETIKISKINKNDRVLADILDKIMRKITKMREQL